MYDEVYATQSPLTCREPGAGALVVTGPKSAMVTGEKGTGPWLVKSLGSVDRVGPAVGPCDAGAALACWLAGWSRRAKQNAAASTRMNKPAFFVDVFFISSSSKCI